MIFTKLIASIPHMIISPIWSSIFLLLLSRQFLRFAWLMCPDVTENCPDANGIRVRIWLKYAPCVFVGDRGMIFNTNCPYHHAKSHPIRVTVMTWLRRRDLNPWPSGYEPDELPTALLRDIKFWRRPTLPGTNVPSTIGSGGLNCRVRDGNGCTPSDIVTRNL